MSGVICATKLKCPCQQKLAMLLKKAELGQTADQSCRATTCRTAQDQGPVIQINLDLQELCIRPRGISPSHHNSMVFHLTSCATDL